MHALIKGGIIPRGTVQVSGAKNSATRLLAAALLTDESVYLSNFPTSLVDVGHKIRFMRNLGGQVQVNSSAQEVVINAGQLCTRELSPEQLNLPIRTTYLLAAGQLARGKVAFVPYPGGCAIGGGPAGGRGYDLHMMVWRALGCVVTEKPDCIEVVAEEGLRGGIVDFPISTVGGTENALLCASVASGDTEISNAYITPEINDLIDLLRRMGADISVFGTSKIRVRGNGGLLSGAHKSVMPDRIEALTWIIYGILSGGNLTINGIPFDSMEVPFIHLEKAGVDLFKNSDSVHITPDCLRSGTVQPFELACGTHPGVISDMQALFVLLATRGEGISRIYDYRYPERIAFADQLAKFVGEKSIDAERGKITVNGPVKFTSAIADSTDLRGSMAVVIAALCADGESRIDNVQMALRGYDNLDSKLRVLGIDFKVEND